MTTLILELKKIENDGKTMFYSNSIAEAIITESHIDHAFESIYITIIANIQKPL